ncbi:MAG: HK97 family phage prohead protease [Flavobacteriaceae bacterium]|nr:HK97 family phage prohead protease [Flavobacteriaceae bacterium]
MPPKPKKNKAFVFNDGSKNSYGFIIPTSGISLKRFNQNPVMLDSHYNSTQSVLGNWENLKTDNGILTGEPVFDGDDENAAKIARKVEAGYIKSCSMGITFNRDDLKYVEGVLILEKCELYEVSIVAVPSNANAIRLYNTDGELLKEAEVQKLCLSAIPTEFDEVIPTNNNDMKITLKSAILLALGFAAGTTEVDAVELEEKITGLSAKLQAAELKLSQKLEAEETAKLAAIDAEVDGAVKSGKITADKKEKFVNLGIASPDLLTETLAAIPAKASLSALVQKNGETAVGEVKTPDDFQKLSLDAQLQFKQTQPEAYKQLFTKK